LLLGVVLSSNTLIENGTHRIYTIIITTDQLGLGLSVLSIEAEVNNYETRSAKVRIKVIEKPTDIVVYLNDEIRVDNGITLAYGTTLNITVKYRYNLSSIPTHLNSASVMLSGVILSNNTLTENSINNIYTIIINSDQLDLGLSVLAVAAEIINYETRSTNLRIVVRTIITEIKPENDVDEILATVGQTITLRIVINDTDYDDTIKGLQVKYSWAYGTGDLLDPDGDGVYEAVLADVPFGLYQISITVFNASDIYNFEPFRIPISISYTTDQSNLQAIINILIVVSILSAIGFSSYIYAYQKVLKYPKPVRKVRKVKKKLKKKKSFKVDVLDRSNTLKNVFETELGSRAKFLKKKSKEDILPQKTTKVPSKVVSTPSIKKQEPPKTEPQAKPVEKQVIKPEEKPQVDFIDDEARAWVEPVESEEKTPKNPISKPEVAKLPKAELIDKPKIQKMPTVEPIDKIAVKELPSAKPLEKLGEEKEKTPPSEPSESSEKENKDSSPEDSTNNSTED
jgi:hypothetical protein